MTQVTLKLPDEEVARLDQLIEAGRFPNRHAALRAAFERLLQAQALAAARRSIAEEPW
jgi:Arc/MetJ-type ribon-helix-helix transcriptional regulator